ncbi:hypothetical protein AL755_06890 [Arthrobacter sp. ERGS1:01]|uniref:hypothetical protein n=1 Tax=Arthrobacter sp. ERGS1:01 TaxID=1704044 RepID=UPI0006B5DD8D|nr:hypothetical protein [Arthrobacter sp. ERGS1:01]ALE05262.1 hypothetical protein AL755_06890 [Arthrobacter sp. ERGS1:01]
MNQQSVINILIAVVVLVWILSRQLRAKPLREQRPYTLMIVLGVLGLVQIAQLAGKVQITGAAYAALVIGLVSGAVFGWLRGRFVHLWRVDGVLTRQGNWLTVVLWVVGIAIHLGLDDAGVLLSPNNGAVNSLGTVGIMLYLAVALAAQRFATLARAKDLEGSAPVRQRF